MTRPQILRSIFSTLSQNPILQSSSFSSSIIKNSNGHLYLKSVSRCFSVDTHSSHGEKKDEKNDKKDKSDDHHEEHDHHDHDHHDHHDHDHHDHHEEHDHDHHDHHEEEVKDNGKYSYKKPPSVNFFKNEVLTPRGKPQNGMLWGVDKTTRSEEERGDIKGPYTEETGAMFDVPRGMLLHNTEHAHAYVIFMMFAFLLALIPLLSYSPFERVSAKEELYDRMTRIENFTKWLSEQPEEVQNEYKAIIKRGIESRLNKAI